MGYTIGLIVGLLLFIIIPVFIVYKIIQYAIDYHYRQKFRYEEYRRAQQDLDDIEAEGESREWKP